MTSIKWVVQITRMHTVIVMKSPKKEDLADNRRLKRVGKMGDMIQRGRQITALEAKMMTSVVMLESLTRRMLELQGHHLDGTGELQDHHLEHHHAHLDGIIGLAEETASVHQDATLPVQIPGVGLIVFKSQESILDMVGLSHYLRMIHRGLRDHHHEMRAQFVVIMNTEMIIDRLATEIGKYVKGSLDQYLLQIRLPIPPPSHPFVIQLSP